MPLKIYGINYLNHHRKKCVVLLMAIISFRLVLHDVQGEVHDSITTPIDVFWQFVDFIYNHGMGLCSMRYYLSMPQRNDNLGLSVHLMTDMSDYITMLYQYCPSMVLTQLFLYAHL